MGTTEESERKVLYELANLLRQNADRILSGETKLCLTTKSLGLLSTNFRRLSENEPHVDTPESVVSTSSFSDQKKRIASQEAQLKIWQENMRTLYDFVLKTVSLKVIHGSYTMQAPIQISRFHALQVLEVKKVPIHMVEGLSKLRGQIRKIIVSRSLQKLENLFEICGGDRSTGMVWQQLKTAFLSFNGLMFLDNSLRFIPYVDVLDLSHNSINKTEDYLQNLTDVLRLNLGFNMLSSIPQFSYSNKGKLRTLVLRRNNLDNLEGIEELISLEELDVADNCLVDMQCLHVLADLHKLNILCLLGNPLSYQTNYRIKTLEYVSPQAGLAVFLLDNTQLTQQEYIVLKDTHYQKRRELESDSTYVVLSDTEGPDSSAVANGNGTGSHLLKPGHSNKKYGHRRMRSKERIPVIVDIADVNDSVSTSATSATASPSTSVHEGSYSEAEVEKERRKIEIIRDHYKDDWLKALTAEQEYNKTGSSTVQNKSESVSEQTVVPEKNETVKQKPEDKTDATDRKTGNEDKLPVEDSIHGTDNTTDNDFGKITVEIRESTDIYTLQKVTPTLYCSTNIETPVMPVPVHVEHTKEMRADGVEWSRTQSEQETYYGEESEPFIVMLPNEQMKQLLVSLNERYLIEKDLNGSRQEMLDLKCLESVIRSQQACTSKDIVESIIFPIITLDFSYIRKDKRQRVYAMENDMYAQNFKELVMKHVKAKELQTKMKELLECLKCKHQFYKQNANPGEVMSCPKCKSKMVIELNIRHFDQTTEGSPTSSLTEPLQLSSSLPGTQQMLHKELKANAVFKRKDVVRRSHHGHVDDTSPNVLRRRSPSPSLARPKIENFDELIGTQLTDETDAVSQSVTDTSVNTNNQNQEKSDLVPDTGHAKQVTEETALPRNSSWSGSGQVPRNSLSSVDSDITILGNSSRSSVAVISESGSESAKVLGKQEGDMSSIVNNKSLSSASLTDTPGDSKNRDPPCFVTDAQGQITPVGSPLSLSVCSSMVSSVYENTLAGTGEDKSSVERDSSPAGSSKDSVTIRQSSKRDVDNQKKRTALFGSPDLSVHSNSLPTSVDAAATESSNTEEESIYQTAENTLDNHPSTAVNTGVVQNVSIYDELQDAEARLCHDSSEEEITVQRSFRSRNVEVNKRSAVYDNYPTNSSSFKSDSEDITQTALDIPEDLSPIKRGSQFRKSRKSRKSNRSALIIEDPADLPSGEDNSSIEKLDNFDTANTSNVTTLSYSSDSHSPSEKDTSTDISREQPVVRLPWEMDGDKKSHDHLDHDEFVNIDHRLQLYLELNVFKDDEMSQCAIECNIVQYMKVEEMRCFVVVSSKRMLIFQIQGDYHSESLSDWLNCIEDQPITELRFIDIGLGYQSLRLEFDTDCSSFTLVIADEGKCQRYLTLLSSIVQKAGISDHSNLEGISKSNPSTLENLQSQVLHDTESSEDQELVKYFIIQFMDTEDPDKKETLSLVVTTTDMCLVKENHQWPLPRLQAPLTGEMKGQQFTIKQREKINNVETLEFNEYNPKELRLSFFDEGSDIKIVWVITMETTLGVKSLVDSIRGPWEEQFGISLDVTPVSFSE